VKQESKSTFYLLRDSSHNQGGQAMKGHRTLPILCLLVLLSSIFFLYGTALSVPGLISYQGKLSDNTGTPLEGSQNIIFRLYDSPFGGTELWSETQTGIPVTMGIYDVRLGAVVPLDEDKFTGNAVYLQIEIDNGSDWEVLSPRQQLTSTAFAFKAADAATLQGKTFAEIQAEETDPTVLTSVKDGVAWTEVSTVPAGFADGVDADSGGDITGVTAGMGLAGGGTSGDIAMAVNTSVVQQRVTGTCVAGQSIRSIASDGTVTCEPDDIGIPACDVCDGRFVNTAGDIMTGKLSLSANGLAVGTNQLVAASGRVGIGTSAPNEQLEITGNLRLPASTATTGIIRSGTATLLHTYGSGNFFAGKFAGNLTLTGIANTASGEEALYANTTGSYNTACGYSTLRANTEGEFNTANGVDALSFNTTGTDNMASGYSALYLSTTGDGNSASGGYALYANTTGSYNTASGYSAGSTNTTGSYNTFVGYNSDASSSNLQNATAIGYDAIVTASNRVRIGNDSVSWIGGHAAWSNTSDMREKKDIRGILLGLDFITALRPVEFRMLNGNDRLDCGFIAQDIEALLGEDYNILGVGGDSERTLSLRYTDFIAPMIKAMQEQQEMIERQEKMNEQQKAVIVEMRSELDTLKAEIKTIRAGR